MTNSECTCYTGAFCVGRKGARGPRHVDVHAAAEILRGVVLPFDFEQVLGFRHRPLTLSCDGLL